MRSAGLNQDGAQRSMTAYLRSVFLAPNKAVFDVRKLPTEEYALSLGLSGAPKLRFIKKGSQAERMSSAQDLVCFLASPASLVRIFLYEGGR